jgi:transposase
MGRKAREVTVTELQRELLEGWIRNAAATPHRLVERCRVVLMSADGMKNRDQAERLGIHPQRVWRWRARWAAHQSRLAKAEGEASEKDLIALVVAVLNDSPRAGCPTKFSAEELTQIISVACEPPSDSERPVTHWTPRELADEVVKRGIVDRISPRHIDRFLKKGAFGLTKPSIG